MTQIRLISAVAPALLGPLAHPTAGNPALPYSQNSISNLPFPQLFGWRLHNLELAAGLNDHKARALGQEPAWGGGLQKQVGVRARTQLAPVIGGG